MDCGPPLFSGGSGRACECGGQGWVEAGGGDCSGCRIALGRLDGLLGAAFAGDEDADALEQFGRRACALGEEDVGAAGALECADGAGNDHCREAGVDFLGAADEFAAVHLRHDEVGEKEVDGAWVRVGDGFESVEWIDGGDYAVASSFEEEGSDGEDLFVVIDAEDSLLGTHGFSVLPACIADRLQNRSGDAAWRIGLAGAFAGWRARCRAA